MQQDCMQDRNQTRLAILLFIKHRCHGKYKRHTLFEMSRRDDADSPQQIQACAYIRYTCQILSDAPQTPTLSQSHVTQSYAYR